MRRDRGQAVRVTARLIEDNPAGAEWLLPWLGHDITVFDGGLPVHNAGHCARCGGIPR